MSQIHASTNEEALILSNLKRDAQQFKQARASNPQARPPQTPLPQALGQSKPRKYVPRIENLQPPIMAAAIEPVGTPDFLARPAKVDTPLSRQVKGRFAGAQRMPRYRGRPR